MKNRKTLFILIGIIAFIGISLAKNNSAETDSTPNHPASVQNTTNAPKATTTTGQNKVQVALLLDTSGSMSGLIEQAKSQLWNILNTLAKTEKDGEETELEIALYEYGNPSKTRDAMQINQLSGFTTDMDLISEKLFSLFTDGGEEYCGAIIRNSVEHLEWSDSNALKIIYIAGNEPFTQGRINFKNAVGSAVEKEIIINTIFCGDYKEGVKSSWFKGAQLGHGSYFNIDHNKETVYIPTPYDDSLDILNVQLNNTYIPYGEKGKSKKENQILQDNNAAKYSTANKADRTAFKSSKKYKATDWDLVDAYNKDKKIIEKVQPNDSKLKDLTPAQLEIEIQRITSQRSVIQQQIQQLNQRRSAYTETQKDQLNDNSLGSSIIKSIIKQAESRGFSIAD